MYMDSRTPKSISDVVLLQIESLIVLCCCCELLAFHVTHDQSDSSHTLITSEVRNNCVKSLIGLIRICLKCEEGSFVST